MAYSGHGLQAMMRWAREGLISLGRGYEILEIGAQQVNEGTPSFELEEFIHFLNPEIAAEKFVRELPSAPYLKSIFDFAGVTYHALDIDVTAGADYFDLNYDILNSDLVGKFDLVTNMGTSEHVANQFNVFRVMHDALRVGGVVCHQVPFSGFLNHGFFKYQPRFFVALALANGYKIEKFGFSGPATYETFGKDHSIFDGDFIGYSPSVEGSGNFSEVTLPTAGLNIMLRKLRDSEFVLPTDVGMPTPLDLSAYVGVEPSPKAADLALTKLLIRTEGDKYIVEGNCPFCSTVIIERYNNLQPIVGGIRCPNAGSAVCRNLADLHADMCSLPYVKSHVDECKTLIAKSEHVVVVGSAVAVNHLLNINPFGLRRGQVVGVASVSDNICAGNGIRCLPLDELLYVNPEVIIVAAMPPGAEVLRDNLIRRGANQNSIISMFPLDAFPALLTHYWEPVWALPRHSRVVVWPMDRRLQSLIDKGAIDLDQIVAFVDAEGTDLDGLNPMTTVRGETYPGMLASKIGDLLSIEFDAILCLAPENQAKILSFIHFQPYRQTADLFCISGTDDLWYVYGTNFAAYDGGGSNHGL